MHTSLKKTIPMLQKGKLKFIQLIEGRSRVEHRSRRIAFIFFMLYGSKRMDVFFFYFFKIIRWEGTLEEIGSWLSFPNLNIMAFNPDKRRYCKRSHNLRSGGFSHETCSVVPPPLPSIPSQRLTASQVGFWTVQQSLLCPDPAAKSSNQRGGQQQLGFPFLTPKLSILGI